MSSVEGDDWRLQGQERYLQGVTLRCMTWRPSHSGNDHDHCEFCARKFASPQVSDSIQEGYCTPDSYRWVCPECFQDFRERFRWALVQ